MVPNLILSKIKTFKNRHGTDDASHSIRLNRFKLNTNEILFESYMMPFT